MEEDPGFGDIRSLLSSLDPTEYGLILKDRTIEELFSSGHKSNGNITLTDLTFGPQTRFSI